MEAEQHDERKSGIRCSDLPIGEFRIVTMGGREIGVIRLPDGTVSAVRNVCPHRGAPVCRGTVSGTFVPSEPGKLTYDRDGWVLRCPWHGWEFDLQSGRRMFGSSTTRGARLTTYEMEEIDGEIVMRGRARPQ